MSENELLLSCGTCNAKFTRLDHKKRHEQTHLKAPSPKCSICEKTFSRRDAAKRHEKSHHLPQMTRAKTSRIVYNKSCVSCSRSRLRCSGSRPCRLCQSKGLTCVFVPRKPRATFNQPPGTSDRLTENSSPVGSDSAIYPTTQNETVTLNADNGAFHGGKPMYSSIGYPGLHDIRSIQPSNPTLFTAGYTQTELTTQNMGVHTHLDCQFLASDPTPYKHFQDPTAINWLPFDNSTSPATTLSENDATIATSVAVGAVKSLHSTFEKPPVDLTQSHEHMVPESSSSSLHSRMSALVMSMTAGLSDVSTRVPDNDGLTFDATTNTRPVTFYADGAGARTSQTDRIAVERRQRQNTNNDSASPSVVPDWLVAIRQRLRETFPLNQASSSIPDAVLDEALSRILPKLRNDAAAAQYLQHEEVILQRETLKLYIHMYFQVFHPSYPFLDQSLLCIPVWGWALCVATATIGAKYLSITSVTDFSYSLCVSLEDVLSQEALQCNQGHVEDSLPYIQARALIGIGLCHSRKYSLLVKGFNVLSLLCNSCLRLGLLDEDDGVGGFEDGHDIEQVWIAWRFRESRRRTGLFIWLFDCILAIATQTPPRFPAKALNLRLSSSDQLWAAENSQRWYDVQTEQKGSFMDAQALANEDRSRMTVREAVLILSKDLKLPDSALSFSTSIIIHALVRKVWDSSWYDEESLNQPPPQQKSVSADGSLSGSIESVPFYLAMIPEYTSWRNKTCDALDIIHWDALGASAKAGGRESVVFLQLHLARLIILTPVKEFLGYAYHCRDIENSLAGATPLLPSELYGKHPPYDTCVQTISTWAKKDRYKARLAVVHAGATYWHVRRFSSNSFVEPLAVYLAALTLWLYGKFHLSLPKATINPTTRFSDELCTLQGASPSSSTQSQDLRQNDQGQRQGPYHRRMPTHIQIDRPVDDELVQHFIRSGETMVLELEGVEDLFLGGPHRALKEGAAILDLLGTTWSLAESYRLCLEAVFRTQETSDA